jgi:hypothetical protein
VIDADEYFIEKQILAFVVTVEIDIDAPSKRTRALNRKMGFRGRKIRKTIAFSLHYDVLSL